MKNLLLTLGIAITFCSCEAIARKAYGITDPQPETTESIRQYAQKINLELDNILVLKEEKAYNNVMNDFNGSIPEAILFDAEGHQVAYKKNEEDCNAGLFSTLPNLRKNTTLQKKNLILKDFLNHFTRLDGKTFSTLPQADYYLFINWAKFMGKLNKDHVKVWEKMANENKKVHIKVYKVNMDIQEKWNVK